MKKTTIVTLLIILVGCGGLNPIITPDAGDLTGEWTFTVNAKSAPIILAKDGSIMSGFWKIGKWETDGNGHIQGDTINHAFEGTVFENKICTGFFTDGEKDTPFKAERTRTARGDIVDLIVKYGVDALKMLMAGKVL